MARNIFVTGATSGIGLCIAEAYAKHGDNVLISGRRAELLGEVQARLSKEHGMRVETLVLDVRSREDVESKVPVAIEAFGASMCSLIMRVLHKGLILSKIVLLMMR